MESALLAGISTYGVFALILHTDIYPFLLSAYLKKFGAVPKTIKG
jgi:hypothetical protein